MLLFNIFCAIIEDIFSRLPFQYQHLGVMSKVVQDMLTLNINLIHELGQWLLQDQINSQFISQFVN